MTIVLYLPLLSIHSAATAVRVNTANFLNATYNVHRTPGNKNSLDPAQLLLELLGIASL